MLDAVAVGEKVPVVDADCEVDATAEPDLDTAGLAVCDCDASALDEDEAAAEDDVEILDDGDTDGEPVTVAERPGELDGVCE